jgi:hypothetical protein
MISRGLIGCASATLIGMLTFLALAGRAWAGAPTTTATQTSASYKMELDIGPAAMMLTPDQAATATSGEVMVDTSGMSAAMNMPGMSMGSGGQSMPGMGATTSGAAMPMSMMQMATTDNGMPVNHHIEVHIYDRNTGAAIASPVPTIMITDNSTGATRTLTDVMGMYDIQTGTSDLHFGNNVYLQDGDPYTITVTEGPETVTFANVVPSGGMGLPSGSAMGSMGSTPASQPGQSMP